MLGPARIVAAPALELRRGDDPGEGLLRLLRQEIEAAAAALADPDLPRLRAVHAARRHVKRARTAARLLRGVLGAGRMRTADAALRDAMRLLAGDRDADVLAALAGRLAEEAPRPGRPALQAVAARAAALPRHTDARSAVNDKLTAALDLVIPVTPPPDAAALVAGEMTRLYAKGRKAMRQARRTGDDKALHDWRKRIKDRWHAVRFMKKLWPEGDRPRARQLDGLGEMLGRDHDLAMLAGALEAGRDEAGPAATEAALVFVKQRRKALRPRIFAHGEALYRLSRKDVAALWKTWAKERRQ